MAKNKDVPEKIPRAGNRTAADKPEGGSGKKGTQSPFPMVGLGASAGGLEALKTFFAAVPETGGMAYIVVVHMSPKQPSIMPELLQKVARIPVAAAEDGRRIEPDHAYVIPPDKEITVYQGRLQLLDKVKKGASHVIDLFLRSLAQDQGRNAAAIILSGTGSDGTFGINDIKANEGLVLVQSEESAGYDGMPRSAINTGLVDMVLSPEEMPQKLVHYFSHPPAREDIKAGKSDDERQWLNKIFAILRTQVGHDFSPYKPNTTLRRIARRMSLNQIDDRDTYVRYLRENPGEVEALFRDLLIGVTSFFRDAKSFEALKTNVLPRLLARVNEGEIFRAWIPGCATGEEVYSLIMVLREVLDQQPQQIKLQVFGTDIDNHAIDKAREGLFPASIGADVSDTRLERFFVREGDFYRIRKEIRDCVVFSVQDVIKDPPFSRLNLLCCRNLLIYLNTEAQKKLLPLFHYTLAPGGVLMLSSSETIGGFTHLFDTVDKKWKLFKRKDIPQALRQIVTFPSGRSPAGPAHEAAPTLPPAPRLDMNQLTRQAILDQFAPTAVLIDAKGEILNVQGRTGKYLETPSGLPTYNVLDLAREGLRIELSSALRAARSGSERVTRKRLSVKTNGEVQVIDLHVCPLKDFKALAGRFLVVFEDVKMDLMTDHQRGGATELPPGESARIAELERELQVTRERHQTVIEELESSNEELKSTNEEMQSSNEELQSTNEELESSKEELQSLNEELQTVNAELQSKMEELSSAQDDMRNLLDSTEIATIFVDNDMRIRRFTEAATAIVNLIPTDMGRPLGHVVSNLNYDAMLPDLREVLRKLTPKETEVQTDEGRWFNMRIMPYRTTDNRIDGAVLTFAAIDDQKKAQALLQDAVKETENARELVRAVFDMNADPMAVLDKEVRIIIANTAFSEIAELTQDELTGMDFVAARPDLSKAADLTAPLKTALEQNRDFETSAFDVKTPEGNQRFRIQGRIIKKDPQFPYRILLHFVTIP
ncbi:MAG: chemotaxis protein CheB [Deltaproteobacteria bacterium]|nr:chemotaxis protein CheB [Deltaproteobacteria bacterium]